MLLNPTHNTTVNFSGLLQETVQRLFQMKPKDDFTQWCEKALSDIESSVDGTYSISYFVFEEYLIDLVQVT